MIILFWYKGLYKYAIDGIEIKALFHLFLKSYRVTTELNITAVCGGK